MKTFSVTLAFVVLFGVLDMLGVPMVELVTGLLVLAAPAFVLLHFAGVRSLSAPVGQILLALLALWMVLLGLRVLVPGAMVRTALASPVTWLLLAGATFAFIVTAVLSYISGRVVLSWFEEGARPARPLRGRRRADLPEDEPTFVLPEPTQEAIPLFEVRRRTGA